VPHTASPSPSFSGCSYYKNVRKEWASLVAAPSYARFQDALAFTRSIGDFHLHVYGLSSSPPLPLFATPLNIYTTGVTHLPEVQSIDLNPIFESLNRIQAYDDPSNPPTLAVVLASDGIWDNWDYPDVTSFIVNPDLRKQSHKRSSELSEEDADPHVGHTKNISRALIKTNAEYANRNFGNQADNATGIVLLLHPSATAAAESSTRK
jgi:serine/threonine protein phosphatase PrpC